MLEGGWRTSWWRLAQRTDPRARPGRLLLPNERPPLVVDQRQELGGGVRIALFDGGRDACDFTHRRHRAGRGGTVWWSIPDGAARRQHALDNDGRLDVEALAPLTGGEVDLCSTPGGLAASTRTRPSTSSVALPGKNRKRPAGLDAIRVEVRHGRSIELGGDPSGVLVVLFRERMRRPGGNTHRAFCVFSPPLPGQRLLLPS